MIMMMMMMMMMSASAIISSYDKSLLCAATDKAKIACRNDKDLLCALGFIKSHKFEYLHIQYIRNIPNRLGVMKNPDYPEEKI